MGRPARDDNFFCSDRPFSVGPFNLQTRDLPAIEVELLYLRLIKNL